ncbi:similar to Saccharomyces cerevisiae YPL088W Putative aryl alcohol dehydrogenase [Maudiozyma saulgeensis]|uniref:Similar to Saccharomyces cerevisiae YPL088W Putative aryl alcohol dehydrogenase n=1 Tax=Maudiozyma saulgeensis TaxID=1789683 RepID=A0A1X7R5S0_9SACH|nr:similar to Saccharomyces cerevisiae YPL088W Putative aryl alcohol dehydrogenase [Kazachstania saulgeensis]
MSLAKQVPFGNTGIKISPIIIGCMSYGTKFWSEWVEEDKEKVFTILKHCYDSGLRTFDTADVYSNGMSERLVGEFLKKYNIRRETVIIMTKVFFATDEALPLSADRANRDASIQLDLVNSEGLSRKHILDAVKNSVERLGTYIDVLQIHRFDPHTPIKETMRALNYVVESGDVRYIGASSMLPTQFVEMQLTADKYNWHQFVNVQSCYNLLYREDERDLNQFCKKHNIALTPWSPLQRGVLTRPVNNTNTTRFKADRLIEVRHLDTLEDNEVQIVNRVEELSKRKNVTMAAIATAWSIAKGCTPILGLSSTERVDDALQALNVKLSSEDIDYLEEPYKPKNFMF